MVCGDLKAAGIRAMQQAAMQSGRMGAIGNVGSTCDVYVEEQDLERAREVLDAPPMSEDELVRAEEEAARQSKAHDPM